MAMHSLREVDLVGKRVLVRADLDVPLLHGQVADDARLIAALPTIKSLVEKKAKVIIIGHLGRPNGIIVEDLRLNPVADRLKALGGFNNFTKLDDCLGFGTEDSVKTLAAGGILVLENLRFYKGEETADENFSIALAKYGEAFVNDCFSASHRASASFVGIPRLLPAFAGFDLENEVNSLSRLLASEARPLVVILGGKKKDKLELLPDFMLKADYILIGSALAAGLNESGRKLLPDNVIIGSGAADLNELSQQNFITTINKAKTVIWGGPLGKFEEGFTAGTKAVAEAVIKSGALSIVGGGDTLAVLDKLGLSKKMSYVSVSGGAMLDFMAGRELPGLKALGYYDNGGAR